MNHNNKIHETLDNSWIIDFEKKEKLYQDFYTDDVYFIHLHFIYIQKNMEIEKIREETFFLKTANTITREEIIGLFKNNSLVDNIKYRLFSLLLFNLSLKPEDIPFFLREDDDLNNQESKPFLKIIKHIETITLEKTISMFHDLNSLYFILIDKSLELNNKDKKTLTKKINTHFLKQKSSKTKRKYY